MSNLVFLKRLGIALTLASSIVSGSDEQTQVQVDLVQPDLIQQRLAAVPHKQSERRAKLESLFREVGCADLVEQSVKGSKDPNVLCTLPGEGPGAIVVGAHFDADGHGSGAVDDWSGAALLPSLYQTLHTKPRRHKIVFVGFAAEELGLLGSANYVKGLPAPERLRIQAMVNLECLGLALPGVWAHRADKQLLAAYANVAQSIGVGPRAVNVERVGDDDSASFLKAKVPVITIHSVTQETWSILHSSRDQVAAINPENYYSAYRLTAL